MFTLVQCYASNDTEMMAINSVHKYDTGKFTVTKYRLRSLARGVRYGFIYDTYVKQVLPANVKLNLVN